MSASVGGLEFRYNPPSRDFDRRRVKGTIASNLRVKDPAHATALEALAGGRLHHVVVDDEKTGMLLLTEGGLQRRVTLIPLSKIQCAPAHHRPYPPTSPPHPHPTQPHPTPPPIPHPRPTPTPHPAPHPTPRPTPHTPHPPSPMLPRTCSPPNPPATTPARARIPHSPPYPGTWARRALDCTGAASASQAACHLRERGEGGEEAGRREQGAPGDVALRLRERAAAGHGPRLRRHARALLS